MKRTTRAGPAKIRAGGGRMPFYGVWALTRFTESCQGIVVLGVEAGH